MWFHGNKSVFVISFLVMVSVSTLLGSLLSAKKSELFLKEKQYKITSETLEKHNAEVLRKIAYEVN